MSEINLVVNINFINYATSKLHDIRKQAVGTYIEGVDFNNTIPNCKNIDEFLLTCFGYLNTFNNNFSFDVPGQCINILNKKNHDYSSKDNRYSNFEFTSHYVYTHEFNTFLKNLNIDYELNKSGFINMVLSVNLGQKIARLKELITNNKQPVNEKIDDSIKDLMNYRLLKEGFNLGLK